MARLRNRHVIEGGGGHIGKFLRLQEEGAHTRIYMTPASENASVAWGALKEAISYARKSYHREEYAAAASDASSSSFEVATFDFLHPPEIRSIDLGGYQGRPGDPIEIVAVDDTCVEMVGVLIVDEGGALVEMGLAERKDRDNWRYVAQKQAPGHHVRVIVDAADLPGHMDEARADKDL